MKNKITIIILILSIVLLLIFTILGFGIGKFEILSVSKTVEKNKNVNTQIDKQSNLTSTTYPEAVGKLETTIENLKLEKEKYEQVSGFESGESQWYETEQYDISYLWKQLGRLATKQKINLAIDVKKAAGNDLYDLYFTIQGEYTNVSSYIKKIEDDSTLMFRIYNFKLVPGMSDIQLKCTFVVKDVRIDPKTLIKGTGTQTTDRNNNDDDEYNNDSGNNSGGNNNNGNNDGGNNNGGNNNGGNNNDGNNNGGNNNDGNNG